MRHPREGGRAWTIAWFALAHLLLVTVGFQLIYTSTYGDFPIYQRYGRQVLLGHLPYASFPAEYPPLAFVFFALPATVGLYNIVAYYAAWVTQVYLADVVALVALDGLARRRGQPPLLVLGVYTALFALVGPLTVREFDMFPAVMTLLAISAFDAEQDVRGWFWLALGTMTKLYPLLLAPVILLRRGRRVSSRDLIRGAAVGLGTCLVAMSPWLVVAPRSLLVFVRYHAQRGLQLESTYASGVLLAHNLGLAHAATANGFGSWNVIGPAAAAATRASPWLMLAALVAAWSVCAVAFARRAPGARDEAAIASVAACCALVLLAAMITSKVLSPQYLIWLLPFLALALGPGRQRRWVLFGAIAITTYYIFPRHYHALIATEPVAVAALLARNVMLVLLTVLFAVDILRAGRPKPLKRVERAA